MLCCVIAGLIIVRIVVRWKDLKRFFGFEVKDDNPYGWEEYCELDEYES
jgi:hypothetical protein